MQLKERPIELERGVFYDNRSGTYTSDHINACYFVDTLFYARLAALSDNLQAETQTLQDKAP
jgi:hypothetical protein